VIDQLPRFSVTGSRETGFQLIGQGAESISAGSSFVVTGPNEDFATTLAPLTGALEQQPTGFNAGQTFDLVAALRADPTFRPSAFDLRASGLF